MRKTFATLAASAILAISMTASAEIRPKSYTFSPFLGGYTFEGDQNVDTSFIFGARAGYDYTKRVGVEALIDFGKTESRNAGTKRDVRLLTAGIEGLYYFMPDSRLVPFLAAGGRGIQISDSRDHVNSPDLDKERLALSYGAGAKYALAEELALRADVRHLVLFDEGWNHLEYTLGLTWIFGGKPAAPAPPPPAPVKAPPVKAAPPAAPTVSLTANPASVEAGKCADLSWSSSNATVLSIQPQVGSVPVSGSQQVCPSASTSYTATATGPGGSATSSASVSVKQPPPPPAPAAPSVSISANPASIQKGQCSDLSWNTSNASSVSIDQGVGTVAGSGTRQVCPVATTSYTITGSGAGGSRTASTSVSVAGPPPPAAPTASISANPAMIQKGQCSNLSWSTTNATNVSIEPGLGMVPTGGTNQVCPPSDTTYRVTAIGAGGTANASTTVSVAARKEPSKEELTIVLAIEFDTDKSVVRKKYEPEVARVAEFMKKYPQVKGVIEGHTDNVGGKAYNDKLSLRRANAVKEQLVKKYGIDGSRLTTAGYGFSKPVADNKTEAGRQQNRRIVANFDTVTIVKP